MTHILWLIFKNNLSILDEEEIKDILGEYYVGINSHRRAPAGGAIAPRPGWRHFTIMSHRLQKWLYIATCWHYLFHWPDFARDSLILEFLNFCIFNKYWPMNFVARKCCYPVIKFDQKWTSLNRFKIKIVSEANDRTWIMPIGEVAEHSNDTVDLNSIPKIRIKSEIGLALFRGRIRSDWWDMLHVTCTPF